MKISTGRISKAAAATDKPSAQPLKFLHEGWLVESYNGVDLHTDSKHQLWLVPHPYQGSGERIVTYEAACQWLKSFNKHTPPEQLLAEKEVCSGDPAKQQQEMRWYKEARQRRRNQALDLKAHGLGVNEISDEQALDFICGVIVDNEDGLESLARNSIAAGDDYNGALLLDTCVAARAVTRRARWHGLSRTPTDLERIMEPKFRREPLLLALPSLRGDVPYPDGTLLYCTTNILHYFHQQILETILKPMGATRKALELAEALMLSEDNEDRDGGCETELDELRPGESTTLQKTVASLRRQLLCRNVETNSLKEAA